MFGNKDLKIYSLDYKGKTFNIDLSILEVSFWTMLYLVAKLLTILYIKEYCFSKDFSIFGFPLLIICKPNPKDLMKLGSVNRVLKKNIIFFAVDLFCLSLVNP